MTSPPRKQNQPVPKHHHQTERLKLGHRIGWSPCAHSIGKFPLWLIGSFLLKLPPPTCPGTTGIEPLLQSVPCGIMLRDILANPHAFWILYSCKCQIKCQCRASMFRRMLATGFDLNNSQLVVTPNLFAPERLCSCSPGWILSCTGRMWIWN